MDPLRFFYNMVLQDQQLLFKHLIKSESPKPFNAWSFLNSP